MNNPETARLYRDDMKIAFVVVQAALLGCSPEVVAALYRCFGGVQVAYA